MNGRDGFGWMSAISMRVLKKRVDDLEKATQTRGSQAAGLRATAAEKLAQGANLTRAKAAAHIGVSTKRLQRMESVGALVRCPSLGTVVRYSARDVLRLASASSPKGA